MIIRRFTTGPLESNCYLVICRKTLNALVIDAGFAEGLEATSIVDEIKRKGLRIKYILSTHWHPDHTAGNEYLKEETGAPILIHEEDAPMLSTMEGLGFLGIKAKPHRPDGILKEGDSIRVGEVILRVLHTPGHTKGSISLLGQGFVFTGDTLFSGSIGRTDLPGGSFDEIIHSIKTRLMTLPDETIVYPGHGPSSSIGIEKKTNPFIKDL